jgi:hypothetical protein
MKPGIGAIPVPIVQLANFLSISVSFVSPLQGI